MGAPHRVLCWVVDSCLNWNIWKLKYLIISRSLLWRSAPHPRKHGQYTLHQVQWRLCYRGVYNFQIPYWCTVPQQWLPCHSENRKVQCYRISLNYISIISLQESVEELVDWANTPLQSSNLQIFQITTGKISSSGPKIRHDLWVTLIHMCHRSNVDCEWRIEGPTGHYLSFNFQQVFDKPSYLSTIETLFLAVWPSSILQLFLRR